MSTLQADGKPEASLSTRLGSPMVALPSVAGTWKWHLLTIVAGSMLVATFFMPLDHLTNWSSRETPVRVCREVLRESDIRQAISLDPEPLGSLVYLAAVALLPHLWGMLAVLFSIMSLLGLWRLRRIPQAIGVSLGVLIGATWALCAVRFVLRFSRLLRLGPPSQASLLLLVLLAVTSIFAAVGVLYALLALRRRGWAYLYHGFVGQERWCLLSWPYRYLYCSLIVAPAGGTSA